MREINQPKYKIGDTFVRKMRWFLWFNEYVLCYIVGGRWCEEDEEPQWQYTFRIGNQIRRYLILESELDLLKD